MNLLRLQKNLSALIVLILACILISAFGIQFLWKETPCPLCLLQRLGMIGVATALLLNLRFGVRPSHYGLALLSALVGGAVALRHIALHAIRGSPTFGIPVFGLGLYTWSFIIFSCCILAIALLLFLYRSEDHQDGVQTLSFFDKFVSGLLFVVVLVNVITTFQQCGLGLC